MKSRILLMTVAIFIIVSSSVAQEKGTFTDSRDGKVYKTIKIGTQIWMAENLAYKPSTGNYAAYENNQNNVIQYGYLYSWETAKNVCPPGWHLPTAAEWETLISYLGGKDVAGRKLKESGTAHWKDENDATNISGFTALPGGASNGLGEFALLGISGHWWSASETDAINATSCSSMYAFSIFSKGNVTKKNNFSVRCIKTDGGTIPASVKTPNTTQVNAPASPTQIVNIPDAKFKAKLIGIHLDLNKDGQIQFSEARAVKVLDISEASISDLTGIEAFTNLTNLKCSRNLFTNLNLRNNIALTELDCSALYLNALDLTRNPSLKTLICSKDHLFVLDLSKNTALTNLQCHQNNLTALDLSANRALKEIYCGNNQLKNLDVSINTALQTMNCVGNPSLEKVCVNTTQLGLIKTTTHQWQKGDTASWSTECSTEK